MIVIRSDIKVIAFDLDGTIYNGAQIINGALETIEFFRKIGKKICFFTNNSSLSRIQIFTKLRKFSINLTETDIYCCSYAVKVYLREEKYKNLFVIGSNVLKEEVSNSGINVFNEARNNQIDALLIGMDVDFSFFKLSQAYEVLQRNDSCKIIVCNMDCNFPVEDGLRKPGCGAIASSILVASNRDFDFMIGKPNSYMLNLIAKEKNVLPKEILVIGDSFESDIAMANNTNSHSILIDNSGSINPFCKISVGSIDEVGKIFNKYFL